jgi:hypothetical protein
MKDIAKFMNFVYRPSDPEKLHDYMMGHGRKQSLRWIFKATMTDLNDMRCVDHRGYWIGERLGAPKMGFYCHLVIPRAHLQLVTDRILEACKRRNK